MSNCAFCKTPNGYQDGGWLCLTFDGASAFACQVCTGKAVMAWAREIRRQGIEKNPPPTPTNSPAGAGTPYVEQVAAVA